jgi:hypothetical protein
MGKSANNSKKCSKCKEHKSLSEFNKDKQKKDGLESSCRACGKLKADKYYLENKEKILSSQKSYRENHREKANEYYKLNKDKINLQKKQYNKSNSDIIRVRRSRYYLENKEIIRERASAYLKTEKGRSTDSAASMRRKAAKLQAIPKWFTDDDQQYIKDLYKSCREFEAILSDIEINQKFHIDHMLPLKSREVCGFHHPHNLQVLSREDNLKKSNRLEEDIIWAP